MLIGLDGNPRGTFIHKPLAWDAAEGALPSWLTPAPDSSWTAGATYARVTNDGPEHVRIVTQPADTAADNLAWLTTAGFSTTGMRWCRLRAVFSRNTDDGGLGQVVALQLGAFSGTRGSMDAGTSFGKFNPGGSGAGISAKNVSTKYLAPWWPYLYPNRLIDLSIWLDIPNKGIFVGSGNRVEDAWDAGDDLALPATLQARLFTETKAGPSYTNPYVKLYALRFDRWY